MTTSKLYLQNLYEPTLTSATVASSWDVTFALSITPSYTKWFITFSPSNASQREIMYFDDVIGSTVYVKSENRWLGWTTAKAHTQWEIVAMKDVAEIFNFFSDNISNAFYVEKKGWLNVNVWGWSVYYNGAYQNFSDTALVLTANSTNYIQYNYTTNTISASLVDNFRTKAIVVTWPTSITSITYQVAKESYIDFTVTLNTALPSQGWFAGRFLQTDGANASWQDPDHATTTVDGTVELPTRTQIDGGVAIGETGAPLAITADKVSFFWDGSDWDVVISVNTTLTSDMYYNNLTVNTWVTLDPAWYIIYVAGTLTLSGTAKIIRNGNNGGNASGNTPGAASAALATGTCWPNFGWPIGLVGTVWGNSANWANGAWINPSYAVTWTGAQSWAQWWAGGWYTAWTPGVGWSAVRWALYNTVLSITRITAFLNSPQRVWTITQYWGLPWVWQSTGWTAWGTSSPWASGGGGWNGWIIFIYANTIAWTGSIESKWWNWGNGGNSVNWWTWAGSGWAGGSGGCGWIVFLVYHTWTPWTITLTWGTGWTGWTGHGGWSSGWTWVTWTTWQSIVINK